ncbi:MAG: TRAP transporter substrate-binding protein DctP [Nitrospinaceae bacterium]|nr:ABC transporter substrate-binding protein [Nitrospinota bacterium]MDP6335773.1 TRAP transporter substrate-binding protein DctP [Nitrospinaceae bacterium]
MSYFNRLTKLFLLTAVLFFVGNAGQVFAGDKEIIKFATLAPEGTAWMKEMHALANEVKKVTGGAVKFKFYPGGVSGNEKDVIRKMRIGQLHGAGFTGVGLGEILPEVRVFDIPFLFETDEQVNKIYDLLNDHFVKQYDKKGYVLLGWVPVGWVHIFSANKIESVGDLVKSKPWMWEGDPLVQEAYSAMDVKPVPLSVTDVLMSLQTGMIDTVYGSSQAVLALQWFTRVKHMAALRMGYATGGVLVSKRKFKKLSGEHQKVLLEVSQKHLKILAGKIQEDNRRSVDVMVKNGIQIIPVVSDAEKEKFRKAGTLARKNLTGRLFSKEILDQVLSNLQ